MGFEVSLSFEIRLVLGAYKLVMCYGWDLVR